MLTRIAIADQFLGPRIEILLTNLHAFAKRRRCRMIQNPNPTSRTRIRLNPVQPRPSLWCSHTRRPDLPGWQRIGFQRFVAVQFRRRDKLFNPLRPEDVAEMGIPELAFEAPLLLLFNPTPS